LALLDGKDMNYFRKNKDFEKEFWFLMGSIRCQLPNEGPLGSA
jgi:hypothetical protein